MNKFIVFMFLFLIAIPMAGLFSIVHDQISYTVSPEYFTRFKFQQFGLLNVHLPERIRASVMGFLASWWMGIPIGFLVGVVGIIHQAPRRMFIVSMWAFVVVVIFTLLFGFGGLLYGWFQTKTINLNDYQGWYVPKDVIHLRRFLCVGYMHNASYLGGTLAIFVGWVFQILVRIKTRNLVT